MNSIMRYIAAIPTIVVSALAAVNPTYAMPNDLFGRNRDEKRYELRLNEEQIAALQYPLNQGPQTLEAAVRDALTNAVGGFQVAERTDYLPKRLLLVPDMIPEAIVPADSNAQTAPTGKPAEPQQSQSHGPPRFDPKHAIFGPNKEMRFRTNLAQTSGLEDEVTSFNFLGEDQREARVVFKYINDGPLSDATAGARFFPIGDKLEIKVAAQSIDPKDGEDIFRYVVEFTRRTFLRPNYDRYLKIRGGINSENTGDSSLFSAYVYARHSFQHLQVLLTLANEWREIEGEKNDSFGYNGSLLIPIPKNVVFYGGLTKSPFNTEYSKVFGITKYVPSHGPNSERGTAFLAQFRDNPDSNLRLFGFMYGPHHNLFVQEAGVGEAEGWIYGTVLPSTLTNFPSSLSDLRRFESFSNATQDFDIARVVILFFNMDLSLGGKMVLNVSELELFYNIIEKKAGKGKHPLLIWYMGGNYGEENVSNIPWVGDVKSDYWTATSGFRIPIKGGDKAFGLSLSRVFSDEEGGSFKVVGTYRF